MTHKTRVRPFRWFRVKYSPKHVDTSVGHVCMFGDKKHSAQTAIFGADGPVSFAQLYAQVCHVAYSLRHLGVSKHLCAYLDCEDEHPALVGLLGGLRGGLSVLMGTQRASIDVRDATIADHGCTVVLSARPESFVVSDKFLIPLNTLPQITLPKELDWALPRPQPEDLAVRVPAGVHGGWRDISHGELVAQLRDPSDPAIMRLPLQPALARFAREIPLNQPPDLFPTSANSVAVGRRQEDPPS